MVSPSALMPPFARVGNTAARIGAGLPRASAEIKGSNIKRSTNPSAVVESSSGLSVLTSCGNATLRTPGCVHGCGPGPTRVLTFAQPAASATHSAAASAAHAIKCSFGGQLTGGPAGFDAETPQDECKADDSIRCRRVGHVFDDCLLSGAPAVRIAGLRGVARRAGVGHLRRRQSCARKIESTILSNSSTTRGTRRYRLIERERAQNRRISEGYRYYPKSGAGKTRARGGRTPALRRPATSPVHI